MVGKSSMAIKSIIASIIILLSTHASANLIINGGFQNCSLTDWSLDTDGLGQPTDTSDFSVLDSAGQCSANLGMSNLEQLLLNDPSGLSGFANTLSTILDLSGVADSQILDLSFDWIFSGGDLQDPLSDFLSVSLTNGVELDTLFTQFEYGIGTYRTQIDTRYDGWALDFTLNSGFNPDSFSSFLTLDNVSLQAATVPEPHALLLLLLGTGVLVFGRRIG